MGCDIHIAIQAQEPSGEWHFVPWQPLLYQYQVEEGAQQLEGLPIAPACFESRRYHLFGILADVHNGSGFAGVVTGDAWTPIAADRGLPDSIAPDDCPANPLYPDEGSDIGDHSFTWVGLDELKAFDWDGTTRLAYGIVPADVYERLAISGERPTEWSGGISGTGIYVYTPDEYQRAKLAQALSPRPYVRMSWPWTAREATGDWAGAVLPWLESLAAGRPLRLLLGFDS